MVVGGRPDRGLERAVESTSAGRCSSDPRRRDDDAMFVEIGVVLPAVDDSRLARSSLSLHDHQDLVVLAARATWYFVCHRTPPGCPHFTLIIVELLELRSRVDQVELLAADNARLSILLDEPHRVFNHILAERGHLVMLTYSFGM